MRTMIATMLLPLMALVGVELFTRTGNVVATPVNARQSPDGASCRVDGAGRLRITERDADRVLAEQHQFDACRNGGLVAYAALVPSGLDVLVCSEAGNVLQRGTFSATEVGTATAVSKVRLLSTTRAFIELHVNPSANLGVLIDFRTGERRTVEGHDFTISPDGKDLAYFREPAHGTPAGAATSAGVYVNDHRLADLPRDSGASLRWKADRSLTAAVRAWDGAEEAYELKPF